MVAVYTQTQTPQSTWNKQEVWFALIVYKNEREIYKAEITLHFTQDSDPGWWKAIFYLFERYTLDVDYLPTTRTFVWKLWRQEPHQTLVDYKTIDLNTGRKKRSDPVIFGRREDLRLRINTRLKLT